MTWSKLNPHPPLNDGFTPAVERPATHTANPAFRLKGMISGRLRAFQLAPSVTTVGSHRDNDLVLPGVGVSKRHAIVQVVDGVVTIEDRGSKNGTWINGRRMPRARIHVGDEIGFGALALELAGAHPEDGCLAISFEDNRPPNRTWSHSSRESRETEMVTAGTAKGHHLRLQGKSPRIRFPEGHIVGRSPKIETLYRDLETVASSPYPALILGETGSGKEMISRAVHESSARRDGPFVAVNCAAIPADLMEAEMFGVAKGAATGVDPRPGCFVRANGGTLFLDEVGEIHPDLQAKLLRALEYGEVQPVGGKPAKVDVRIVSATNVDLERRILDRGFRADLYYRLAASVLRIPPLRERPEDLPTLIQRFIERISNELQIPVRGVTQRAFDLLMAYPWPGNIRELQHELRQAVQKTTPRQALDSSVLNEKIAGPSSAEPTTPLPTTVADPAGSPQGSPSLAGSESETGPAATPAHASDLVAKPAHWNLKEHVADVERRIIAAALEETQHNRTLAAQLLQISRNTLATKIALYGLS